MKTIRTVMSAPFGGTGKSKIAVALTVALSTSAAVQADTLLFPNIDTRSGYVTFVNLVNKSSAEDLHWIYRYDDESTLENDCLHLAGFSATDANDVMTVQVGSGSGTIFPIPASDMNSTGFGIGPGWSGYLMLYAYTGVYPGAPSPEHTLFGEATVVNVATGEIFKYRANNDPAGITEANMDDLAYGAFGGITGTTEMPTAIWYPTAIVSAAYNVLVADSAMNQQGTAPSVRIGFADVSGGSGSFYDANGNLLGGAGTIDVACFGSYSLADFLPGAALAQAAGGGWAHIQIIDQDLDTPGNQAPFNDDRGIIVSKAETTSAITGDTQSVYTSANRVDY
jgi:hypothetical protein